MTLKTQMQTPTGNTTVGDKGDKDSAEKSPYEMVQAKRDILGTSWIGDKKAKANKKPRRKQYHWVRVLAAFSVILVMVLSLLAVGGYVMVQSRRLALEQKYSKREMVTFDMVCSRTYGSECILATEVTVASCVSRACSERILLLSEVPEQPIDVSLMTTEKNERELYTNHARCMLGKWCMDTHCVSSPHPDYRREEPDQGVWHDIGFIKDDWKCVESSQELFERLVSLNSCDPARCKPIAKSAMFRLQLRACDNLRLGCEGRPYRLISCGECKGNKNKQNLRSFKENHCNYEEKVLGFTDTNDTLGQPNPCYFRCKEKDFLAPDGLYCQQPDRPDVEAVCFNGMCEVLTA